MEPTKENHFPTGIFWLLLHHVYMPTNHNNFPAQKKKNNMLYRFKNGGQIIDFYFVSFWFWPKSEKKKKKHFPKGFFQLIKE